MFKNCCPHALNFYRKDDVVPFEMNGRPVQGKFTPKNGEIVPYRTIAPSGEIPRVKSDSLEVGMLENICDHETMFGETQGLPPETKGIILIVSGLILAANKERKDLRVPYCQVVDKEGKILGCLGLSR